MLRSYSNNIGNKELFLFGFFMGTENCKNRKQRKMFSSSDPGVNLDLKAIEDIRYGDHYWVIGCCVKTGRKMAPCYFKTKLIAVNDAGRH